MSQGNKKKKPKRHIVGVGDLVMFYTNNQHAYGIVGEITHVLDKKRVVAVCLAPNDPDFGGVRVVLETAKPEGKAASGEEKHFYAQYITRVVVQASARPPKPPKKVLPAKVIETTDELLHHLEHGDPKERIILATNQPTIDEAEAARLEREKSA